MKSLKLVFISLIVLSCSVPNDSSSRSPAAGDSNDRLGDELAANQNGQSAVNTNGAALPDCGLKDGETFFMSESCKLPAQRTFKNVMIKILKSDMTLDCQNSTLDGQMPLRLKELEKYRTGTSPTSSLDFSKSSLKPHGILIGNSDSEYGPKFKRVENIKIKNCTVERYYHSGIYVSSNMGGANARYLKLVEKMARSPRHTSISNVTSRFNLDSGIYSARAEDIRISDSRLISNWGTGLYLNAYTRHATVTDNLFSGNGYRSMINGHKVGHRLTGREAIAVDGAAYSLIANNRFVDNSAGGVFLYRNSWEKPDSPDTGPREQMAFNNTINNNTFEDMPVAIWVGSRNSMNYGKHSLEWGEASPYGFKSCDSKSRCSKSAAGKQTFLLDHVEHTYINNNVLKAVSGITHFHAANKIVNNAISKETYSNWIAPLMVEADFTSLNSNKFLYPRKNEPKYLIGVKTAYKHTIGRPIKEIVIGGNTVDGRPIPLSKVWYRGFSGPKKVSSKSGCRSLSECAADGDESAYRHYKNLANYCLIEDSSKKLLVGSSIDTESGQPFTEGSCRSRCHKTLRGHAGSCRYEGAVLIHSYAESGFGSCQVVLKEGYKSDNKFTYPRKTAMNHTASSCRRVCPDFARSLGASSRMTSSEYRCFYGGNLIDIGNL